MVSCETPRAGGTTPLFTPPAPPGRCWSPGSSARRSVSARGTGVSERGELADLMPPEGPHRHGLDQALGAQQDLRNPSVPRGIRLASPRGRVAASLPLTRAQFQYGTADGKEPRLSRRRVGARGLRVTSPQSTTAHRCASTSTGWRRRRPSQGEIMPSKRGLIIGNYIGRKNAYAFDGLLDDVKVFGRAPHRRGGFRRGGPRHGMRGRPR